MGDRFHKTKINIFYCNRRTVILWNRTFIEHCFCRACVTAVWDVKSESNDHCSKTKFVLA